MIHRDLKFIYVRLAKNASTSMMTYLFCRQTQNYKNLCGEKVKYPLGTFISGTKQIEKTFREKLHYGYKSRDINHLPLNQIKKNLDTQIFSNYFKFGFVRNPYDRLVSAYKYAKKWYLHFKPNKSVPDFKQFIIEIELQGKYGLQQPWVDGCDFVGRYEHIQKDFSYVCEKIGIPTTSLYKSNTTKHKDYVDFYNDELVELVSTKFKHDIDYFGYEFGE